MFVWMVGLRDNEFCCRLCYIEDRFVWGYQQEKVFLETQYAFILLAFDTFGFLAAEAVNFLNRIKRVIHSNILTNKGQDYLLAGLVLLFKMSWGKTCFPFTYCKLFTLLLTIQFLFLWIDNSINTYIYTHKYNWFCLQRKEKEKSNDLKQKSLAKWVLEVTKKICFYIPFLIIIVSWIV